MSISFPFKEEKSNIFGRIYRPIAQASFQHRTQRIWRPVTMIIDTGADYTLLPRFFAPVLGVRLLRDCRVIETEGVGGKGKVFLLKKKGRVRIGAFERIIPIGFLDNDYIPPLLGRQEFFETFRVVFEGFTTTFEAPKNR